MLSADFSFKEWEAVEHLFLFQFFDHLNGKPCDHDFYSNFSQNIFFCSLFSSCVRSYNKNVKICVEPMSTLKYDIFIPETQTKLFNKNFVFVIMSALCNYIKGTVNTRREYIEAKKSRICKEVWHYTYDFHNKRC